MIVNSFELLISSGACSYIIFGALIFLEDFFRFADVIINQLLNFENQLFMFSSNFCLCSCDFIF